MSGDPPQPTLGAAAGIVLLWIGLGGTLWQRRITRHANRYVTIAGKGGRHRVTRARTLAICGDRPGRLLPVSGCRPALCHARSRLVPALRDAAAHARVVHDRQLRNLLELRQPASGLQLAAAGRPRRPRRDARLCVHRLSDQAHAGPVGTAMDYIVILPTAIPALVLGVGFVWALVGLAGADLRHDLGAGHRLFHALRRHRRAPVARRLHAGVRRTARRRARLRRLAVAELPGHHAAAAAAVADFACGRSCSSSSSWKSASRSCSTRRRP